MNEEQQRQLERLQQACCETRHDAMTWWMAYKLDKSPETYMEYKRVWNKHLRVYAELFKFEAEYK